MTPQARYSSDKHERTVLLFRVSQVRKRGSGGERIIVAPGRRQGPPTRSTGDEFDRAQHLSAGSRLDRNDGCAPAKSFRHRTIDSLRHRSAPKRLTCRNVKASINDGVCRRRDAKKRLELESIRTETKLGPLKKETPDCLLT